MMESNNDCNILDNAIERTEARANAILKTQGFLFGSDVLKILYEELDMPLFYQMGWAQAE